MPCMLRSLYRCQIVTREIRNIYYYGFACNGHTTCSESKYLDKLLMTIGIYKITKYRQYLNLYSQSKHSPSCDYTDREIHW